MKLLIEGHNFEIDEQVRQLAYEKISKPLEKLLPAGLPEDVKIASLIIKTASRWGLRVSFTMILPEKYRIYASNKSERLMDALTGLRNDLERQIKKYRGDLWNY